YNVTNGTVSVTAPNGKGQLRVLVKDWTGGKIGEDGKFMYTTSPVAHGGNVTFTDPGTTQYYTAEDAPGQPSVKFSPAGSSFKTETLSVNATLSESATTGWVKVGNNAQVTLTPGTPYQFTIGQGMSYGESVVVTWGADTFTGKETYRKVDPNAVITVYVTSPSAPYIYAWEGSKEFAGAWPGAKLSATETIDGKQFYYMSFPDVEESLSIIFNNGSGSQTANITGITGDVYYEYDGGSNATEVDVNVGPKAPVITSNPRSGQKFTDKLTVTLTASPATDIYYTLDGTQASASSTRYNGPITLTATTTINAYARNEVGETRTSFTFTKVDELLDEMHAYFDNSASGWSTVNAYSWDDNHQEGSAFSGAWPGKHLTETVQYEGKTLHHFYFTTTDQLSNPMIIFNNGSGAQTSDLRLENNAIYNASGKVGEYAGVSLVEADENAPVRYFNLQGIEVRNPQPGQPLIRVQGSQITKVVLR
ncbi:MAG: starch-binding protein, partial [Muribaculaceae bacterium]|nr:starch-binding protein [Muribaculaceae bacterium]